MTGIQDTYRAIISPFYCRTVMLQLAQKEDDDSFDEVGRTSTYLEAFESDPVLGLWTVQTCDIKYNGDKLPTYTPDDQVDIDFKEAMNIMASFERRLAYQENGIAQYEVVGDSAKKMKQLHFKTYAMMNGLVPDEKGRMHSRPHEMARPMNCTVDEEDLKQANKLWTEHDLSRHNSPFIGFKQTETLSEQFARLSKPGIDPNDIINRKVEKRIEVLERFMTRLETCHKYLAQYSEEFRQLGKMELIEAAEDALMSAREMIEKKGTFTVKSEFKDVEMPHIVEFKRFVDYEAVKIIVMHVQALQTINNEQRYDNSTDSDKREQFELNSKNIAKRLSKAEELFIKIGATQMDIENMRNVATNNLPTVSPELTNIAKDFSTRKKAWFEQAQKGERLKDNAIIPAIIVEQAQKASADKTADYSAKTARNASKPSA